MKILRKIKRKNFFNLLYFLIIGLQLLFALFYYYAPQYAPKAQAQHTSEQTRVTLSVVEGGFETSRRFHEFTARCTPHAEDCAAGSFVWTLNQEQRLSCNGPTCSVSLITDIRSAATYTLSVYAQTRSGSQTPPAYATIHGDRALILDPQRGPERFEVQLVINPPIPARGQRWPYVYRLEAIVNGVRCGSNPQICQGLTFTWVDNGRERPECSQTRHECNLSTDNQAEPHRVVVTVTRGSLSASDDEEFDTPTYQESGGVVTVSISQRPPAGQASAPFPYSFATTCTPTSDCSSWDYEWSLDGGVLQGPQGNCNGSGRTSCGPVQIPEGRHFVSVRMSHGRLPRIYSNQAFVNINGPTATVDQRVEQTTQAAGRAEQTDCGWDLTCIIKKIVATIIGILLEVVYWVMYYIVTPIVQLALSIEPHTASFAEVILPVWVVIRNIMNILFVVIMIFIGLGTLFRMHDYDYKALLVKLIFMVLLINFSLVIAQAILGIADAVQAQFLPNNANVIRKIGYDLIKAPYNNLITQTLNDTTFKGMFQDIIVMIVYLCFGVAALVVFLAIAAFLVIRIVVLWFLLMLSPIAYGLRILKQTRSWADKWWHMFLNYAFFTPLMALFLYITAVIADSHSSFVGRITRTTFSSAPTGDWGQFLTNILTMVLIVGSLWASLLVARYAGVAGASQVIGTASKALNLAGRGTSGAFGRLKQRATTKLAATKEGEMRTGVKGMLGRGAALALSPMEAWKARQERVQKDRGQVKQDMETALRQARDYRRSGTRTDTKALKDVKDKRADELRDKWMPKRADQKYQRLVELEQMASGKGRFAAFRDQRAIKKEKQAILESSAKRGDLDELAKLHFQNQPEYLAYKEKKDKLAEKLKDLETREKGGENVAAEKKALEAERTANETSKPKQPDFPTGIAAVVAATARDQDAAQKILDRLDENAQKTNQVALVGIKEVKLKVDASGKVTIDEKSLIDKESAMVKYARGMSDEDLLRSNLKGIRVLNGEGNLTAFAEMVRDAHESGALTDDQRVKLRDSTKIFAGDLKTLERYKESYPDIYDAAQKGKVKDLTAEANERIRIARQGSKQQGGGQAGTTP